MTITVAILCVLCVIFLGVAGVFHSESENVKYGRSSAFFSITDRMNTTRKIRRSRLYGGYATLFFILFGVTMTTLFFYALYTLLT